METHSYRKVLGNSPASLWKLCVSTKFPTRKLVENTVFYEYLLNHCICHKNYLSKNPKSLFEFSNIPTIVFLIRERNESEVVEAFEKSL